MPPRLDPGVGRPTPEASSWPGASEPSRWIQGAFPSQKGPHRVGRKTARPKSRAGLRLGPRRLKCLQERHKAQYPGIGTQPVQQAVHPHHSVMETTFPKITAGQENAHPAERSPRDQLQAFRIKALLHLLAAVRVTASWIGSGVSATPGNAPRLHLQKKRKLNRPPYVTETRRKNRACYGRQQRTRTRYSGAIRRGRRARFYHGAASNGA